MYRPEGWQNPFPSIDLPTNDFCYSQHDLFTAYEAGADAYGEALKKDGLHIQSSEDVIISVSKDHPDKEKLFGFMDKHPGKGWLVFIPDD